MPLIGLVELVLHVKQTHGAAPPEDWAAARAEVEKSAKPDDLVTFAPKWVDPIGRQTFGSAIATDEREAYPDVSRFPRAFEVSIRGAHSPDLDGWKTTSVSHFGAVTVTTLENPAPIHLVDDLLRHVGARDLHVMLVVGVVEPGPGILSCRRALAGRRRGERPVARAGRSTDDHGRAGAGCALLRDRLCLLCRQSGNDHRVCAHRAGPPGSLGIGQPRL